MNFMLEKGAWGPTGLSI